MSLYWKLEQDFSCMKNEIGVCRLLCAMHHSRRIATLYFNPKRFIFYNSGFQVSSLPYSLSNYKTKVSNSLKELLVN